MTLVVGYIGTDGGVMVSDSQASEQDGSRYLVEKIWTAPHGLLLGYSGNDVIRNPLRRRIEELLSEMPANPSRYDVESKICEAHSGVLPVMYSRHIPLDPASHARTLGGQLLVLGNDADGYYMFDVSWQNDVTWQDARNYHAIGSGATAAQVARATMENYEPRGRTVEELQLLAYRTVKTCITVVAQHLCEPVQLWSTRADGHFAKASDTELEGLQSLMVDWLALERETLPAAFGVVTTSGGPSMPPPFDATSPKEED